MFKSFLEYSQKIIFSKMVLRQRIQLAKFQFGMQPPLRDQLTKAKKQKTNQKNITKQNKTKRNRTKQNKKQQHHFNSNVVKNFIPKIYIYRRVFV